jgi:hypothetical protein
MMIIVRWKVLSWKEKPQGVKYTSAPGQLGTSFSLPRVCLVLPVFSLILGLVLSLLPLPLVFLGGE